MTITDEWYDLERTMGGAIDDSEINDVLVTRPMAVEIVTTAEGQGFESPPSHLLNDRELQQLGLQILRTEVDLLLLELKPFIEEIKTWTVQE